MSYLIGESTQMRKTTLRVLLTNTPIPNAIKSFLQPDSNPYVRKNKILPPDPNCTIVAAPKQEPSSSPKQEVYQLFVSDI